MFDIKDLPVGAAAWSVFMSRMLRANMLLRGFDYEMLADAMNARYKMSQNPAQLRTKVNRGSFSAAFFLQSMGAMGVTTIDIPQFDSQRD